MAILETLSQPEQQQWVERVNNFTTGKAAPKSAVGKHSVDRLKQARSEHEGIQRSIAQGETQIKALKERAMRIEGICEQCIDDIVHWESLETENKPAIKEAVPGLPKGRNGKATAADKAAASN